MTPFRFAFVTSLAFITSAATAQESSLATQTLVRADSKANVIPTAAATTLELNSKKAAITSLRPVAPASVQIALLIDDGLSRSAGIQLDDMRGFVNALPPGAELLVGYMSNGRVIVAAPFSTDRNAAAAAIRLPSGMPGQSASPYFCLGDFVKHWPGNDGDQGSSKARIVMMITNGVDPYNGSTRLSNQDSPYVSASIAESQRAGAAVYSIYYRDSGFGGGGSAPVSGQSYLQQVAEETGGESYYEGSGNPVSLTPYFKQFVHAISETYVATFNADPGEGGREHLLRMKISTSTPKLKLRHANEVRPGNREEPGSGGMQ